MKATRVGIVGGGFAGLAAAQVLGHSELVHVTLIDRRNHHLFQPLLYQVAMAGLSPADIATPIRSILSKCENIDVILDEVIRVDAHDVRVVCPDREETFDYLILACGAQHSYFGHDEWEPYAPGLKTLEQATEIRRRILLAYEEAERCKDPETQRGFLTFVVIGGGPTGVELAGSLAELARVTLSQDFRKIDPSGSRVILIEAGPRILAGFDEDLSKQAMKDLEELGVQIWLNSRVTDVKAEGIAVGKDFISARTVLWAAGVAVSPLSKQVTKDLDRAGRVKVKADLSVPSHPNIFVLGDMAAFQNEKGQALPGLAPVAMQQGRFVARNILREIQGQKREDFHYNDKGMMATIGRKKAVLQSKFFKMTGLGAWLAWLFIHVFYLIGFRNRMLVLLQWAWSYFTFKRGARLIVSRDWKLKPEK